jgi:hypothetical protein
LEVIGPLRAGEGAGGTQLLRLVVRESMVGARTQHLPSALRALRAARSLRKEGGDLLVRLDPRDLDL